MRISISSLTLLALAIGLVAFSAPSASAGGGCRGADFRDERTTDVTMQHNCFLPQVARVEPGQTVSFFNEDASAHTVTDVTTRWGDYEEVVGGDLVTYEFSEQGVYPYFCFLHPGMIGAIVVGEGDKSGDAAAKVVKPASDDDGMGIDSLAAIAAGALAGAVALGLVTTRVVGSRKA